MANKSISTVGGAFEYAAPQLWEAEFSQLEGVICASQRVPGLAEEDLDITWGNNG